MIINHVCDRVQGTLRARSGAHHTNGLASVKIKLIF